MKFIKDNNLTEAESTKSKLKGINKKIGKIVSKKEDLVNKAKEMADSEEPSGKLQSTLAKVQLRQSESEAEKLMLQKQAEILKTKIDTAKKKEKTTDTLAAEAQSANAITCKSCTWTWLLQDGGDDMYNCHKCGYNNTPALGESLNEAEDSYNDYPAAAKKNAQKALDWRDEHGRDEVDAGTAVGWARANQLAKGENISGDTVKRMSSFNRHRKNSSIKPELKATPWKDRGYVAWLIWGGDEGVDWAMKKSKEIDNMKESINNEGKISGSSQEAYKLHMLANKVGQEVAAAFLSDNTVDLDLLTKAIQQDTINKYELRDIVNGTAHKFKVKGFMKDFVTESLVNEAKRLSFKDAGITDMMDLSKAMDALRDSKIDWNQKGQAFVFVSSKEHASAIKALGLDESVVTEAKNTIGLAFKEEQDYLDFKEFVAEQPRGAIRKNIGFDSKTKSWNVEMDVKVLDSIYGEGTPSNKESGWYGGLPDDFESVIIESVVTGFTEAKMTKDKLENLIYSLENENDSWHPSSDSKKKSMLDKLKKDLSKFESVVTEEVVYNSSNTKPEAAKKATKEFGKLLPKANKGVEPYVFAVIKTKARNYRLAIKSGSYVAHEFMSGLRKDGILTADIVKKAVANVIKLNPEEFNEAVIIESVVNEAERYVTDKFKVGDKIKTGFGEWEVIETDYAPGKRFTSPFIFKGDDMKRLDLKAPPTNKNAIGYKVNDGGKYPITGFLYQYKDITKLATIGVDESTVVEARKIMIADVLNKMVSSSFGPSTDSKMREEIKSAVSDAITPVLRKYGNIVESKQSDELAIAINDAITKIDDSMSYVDFAQAVSKVIRDEYGTHLYKDFKKEITKGLKEKNVLQDDPERFVESKKLKHIISLNESFTTDADISKWEKEYGKLPIPKKITDIANAMAKEGFIRKATKSVQAKLWITLEGKSWMDMKDQFGDIVGKFYGSTFYTQMTDTMSEKAAYYAYEVSGAVADKAANDDAIEPAYYEMKSYFNAFGMDYGRNRVFDKAVSELESWMKKQKIETL